MAQAGPYRDRTADLSQRFASLLRGSPLLSDLRTRLLRDSGGFDWWVLGVSPQHRETALPAIWLTPTNYLGQAAEIAALLSRHGAEWRDVLAVLIAQHDLDFDQDVPGWLGWRSMTGAHATIGALLMHFRSAFAWQEGELEVALDGLCHLMRFDPAAKWDGSSPRSLDEYVSRPGEFAPEIALAMSEGVRDALWYDEYDTDPDMQKAELMLRSIESAALTALGRPLYDTPEEEAEALAPSRRFRATPLDAPSDTDADESVGSFADLKREWRALDDLEDGEITDAGLSEMGADERVAEAQRARDLLHALLAGMNPREQAVTSAELIILRRQEKATNAAIALELNDGTNAAAVKKLRQRRDKRLASRPMPPP